MEKLNFKDALHQTIREETRLIFQAGKKRFRKNQMERLHWCEGNFAILIHNQFTVVKRLATMGR